MRTKIHIRFKSLLIFIFMILPVLRISASIPRDILIIGENHENIKNLDPAVCFEIPISCFVNNMYAKLVFVNYINDKFVVEPDIAERWSLAKDGKSWTFFLRKDVRFDNGDRLSASDVVYSLRRVIRLRQSPSWLFTNVLGLKERSIFATDTHTVKVVTNGAPSNEVLTILGNTIGGILNEKEVKSNEKNGDMGAQWLSDHSAGCGPYALREWKKKSMLHLTANKYFHKGVPPISEIIIKDIPISSDRYSLFKKEEIDIAFHLTPEQADSLKNESLFYIVTTPGQTLEYLGMNADFGPFRNPLVRNAVKHAIDYDAIVNKAYSGYAIKNQQFLAKGYLGYSQMNPFDTNIKKAKELMAEAGYADGFEVELVTNPREERRNEAVIIQENLSKIGIRVKINLMDASQMYAKFRRRGINMIVAGWAIDYPDANALTNAFANYKVKHLAWRLSWFDDKASEWVFDSTKEKNEKRRIKILNQLRDHFFEESPFAILHQPIDFWAVNGKVKGALEAFSGYTVHLDFTKMRKEAQ